MNWLDISDKRGSFIGSAGISETGDVFDQYHQIFECMSAPRHACEIQGLRVVGKYTEADAKRRWVESFGDIVIQNKNYTIVISAPSDQTMWATSLDEIVSKLMKQQSIASLDPLDYTASANNFKIDENTIKFVIYSHRKNIH